MSIGRVFPGQGLQSMRMQAELATEYTVVQEMIDGGATSIIESGPVKVLVGLVRRINKGTAVSFIDNIDSLQKALQS